MCMHVCLHLDDHTHHDHHHLAMLRWINLQWQRPLQACHFGSAYHTAAFKVVTPGKVLCCLGQTKMTKVAALNNSSLIPVHDQPAIFVSAGLQAAMMAATKVTC